MYAVQPQHAVTVVSLVWLGDDDEGESMRLTISAPDVDADLHDLFPPFVDHPPPPQRLKRDEPELDPLDPAYISAARWKKKKH